MSSPARSSARWMPVSAGSLIVAAAVISGCLRVMSPTQFSPAGGLSSQPSNGSYNFGPGDNIVSFAQSHGMRVRGHNLVWHSQLPSWVPSLPLNQVQSGMENHITTEVSH